MPPRPRRRTLREELEEEPLEPFIRAANKRFDTARDRILDDIQSGYSDNVSTFRDRLAARLEQGEDKP